ncbi:MAG: hypothetical protein IT256_08230 [Chitinophagaceae bacterium]|nr:hypothetical protein [Chitinophagaceae bacterium]
MLNKMRLKVIMFLKNKNKKVFYLFHPFSANYLSSVNASIITTQIALDSLVE